MSHLLAHLIHIAGHLLSKHMPRGGSSTPTCVACSSPAVKVTRCCQQPLCSIHLDTWQRSPNPCPCGRR